METDPDPEAVLAEYQGRRTIRVVGLVSEGKGGVRELLACGHTIPKGRRPAKRRVCAKCDERIGLVVNRIGPDAPPAKVDLVKLAHFKSREKIARLRMEIDKLRRTNRLMRETHPDRPVPGQVTKGRLVTRVNEPNALVWWVPAQLAQTTGWHKLETRTALADWWALEAIRG